MRIVMFYHSLVSDWNHGNAHFLRGIVTELQARGHSVRVYEPEDGWSRNNLVSSYGTRPLKEFQNAYPTLSSVSYRSLQPERMLQDADLVIVHEWNDPELVNEIGEHRQNGGKYALLFHDTHHRARTQPQAMAKYDLSGFDGVLAFGDVIREIYSNRQIKRAWTWHEAADTRIFRPRRRSRPAGDIVWIGNWGDEERTEELFEYLLKPVWDLKLKAHVYGVRYPAEALKIFRKCGIEYGGWLPNFKVPEAFGCFRLTVHIPRRPYVEALPGIPTIRPFEAMSCGIPLVSAPWTDREGLFTPGKDYLVAHSGAEMKKQLRHLLENPDSAEAMAHHARRTIHSRHTCAHRVDELLDICAELGVDTNHRLPTTAEG